MRTLILAFLFCGWLLAQTQAPLDNQRIIELVRSGVRADELERIISTAPKVSFDLTPAAEDTMLKAGVPEDVIKAMAQRESGSPQQSTSAQPALVPDVITQPAGRAQNEKSQHVDIFGGYSYLNADTNDLSARQSANGWEASVTYSPLRWIGAEADFAGYYRTNFEGFTGLGVHDYGFLGGPRVTFGAGFLHALVGGDSLTGTYGGFSVSQTSFAAAFGGGLQSKPFAGHWAIRTSADYVLTRHNIFGGPAYNQNNFRVSGGIVFVFSASARRTTF